MSTDQVVNGRPDEGVGYRMIEDRLVFYTAKDILEGAGVTGEPTTETVISTSPSDVTAGVTGKSTATTASRLPGSDVTQGSTTAAGSRSSPAMQTTIDSGRSSVVTSKITTIHPSPTDSKQGILL